MLKRAAMIFALSAVSATAAFAGPLVRHAGEWQTSINNGPPRIVCFPNDATFDQAYVTKSMAKIPGASCTISNINTIGNVTSYSMQCTVNGSTMTSSGTITATGPDSFTSKIHSHGGSMKLPNGQVSAFPDMNLTSTSHRLGACKPGDPQNPY